MPRQSSERVPRRRARPTLPGRRIAARSSGGRELPWERLSARQPPSELVTGEYDVDRIDRVKLLKRLMAALRMKHDWAIRVSRDRGRMLVQMAVEEENDALRVTEVLGARPVRRYVGWATQREFEFTPELAERLRKALMLT